LIFFVLIKTLNQLQRKMFPFDRFGLVHFIRILLEFLLLACSYIFGSCRNGIIFGFNDSSSIYFSFLLILITSIDVYYLVLSIVSKETPEKAVVFHIILYSLMSFLTLISCVCSIVGLVFCAQHRSRYLCSNQSCFIYLIAIILTFLLTILFTISTKLLCCFRNSNSN